MIFLAFLLSVLPIIAENTGEDFMLLVVLAKKGDVCVHCDEYKRDEPKIMREFPGLWVGRTTPGKSVKILRRYGKQPIRFKGKVPKVESVPKLFLLRKATTNRRYEEVKRFTGYSPKILRDLRHELRKATR